MNIVWFSDVHFVREGYIGGHDPRARLEAAIAHINSNCADCDFCIISGDLVDVGTAENYAGLVEVLGQLELPFYPMMGNHDEHGLMRAAFELPDGAMADFAQYVVRSEAGLFVCLDTKASGESDAGFLCQARLDWLERVLEGAGDVPVYLFLHHPPVALDIAPFDEIGLENAGALMEVLAKRPVVLHIFAGHLHQPISGSVGGIPFSISPATVYQSRASRPRWGWSEFGAAPAEPTYNVINFEGGNVVIHAIPFCDQDFGKMPG